jgi:hypothetical protein
LFEASLGKQSKEPYLKKNPSQKWAGGVTQGVSPQYCQKKKKKHTFPSFLQ